MAKRKSSLAPKTIDEALARLKPSSEADYAFAAGFVEADGCISVGKSGGRNMKEFPLHRFHVIVLVTQKDPRPVRFLHGLFGGNLKTSRRKNAKSFNVWTVTGNEAYATLTLLEPFIRFKKEQAILAMELQRDINQWRGKACRWTGTLPIHVTLRRREIYFRCKVLNSKAYVSALNIERGEFGGPLDKNRVETIPSLAMEDLGSMEGVTARLVSSNNNPVQERPACTKSQDDIA